MAYSRRVLLCFTKTVSVGRSIIFDILTVLLAYILMLFLSLIAKAIFENAFSLSFKCCSFKTLNNSLERGSAYWPPLKFDEDIPCLVKLTFDIGFVCVHFRPQSFTIETQYRDLLANAILCAHQKSHIFDKKYVTILKRVM